MIESNSETTPVERAFETHHVPDGVPIKSWTRGVHFESEARAQLERMARLPFAYRWIAAMPDVHVGMGATVGSVFATMGAIVPAAVGVVIGCGMIAARTSLRATDLPDSLANIRSSIERAVPHGRTDHGGWNDRGAWREPPAAMVDAWEALTESYKAICERHPRIHRKSAPHHLGTLGTGNHFIEMCLDEEDRVWVMLHSGSRGIGNAIGSYFIELARKDMRRYFVNLPDQDLAYLPEGSENFADYVKAVSWAQEYALANRSLMLESVIRTLGFVGLPPFALTDEAVNCHHNYIAREKHFGEGVWVTRKGAVRARVGDLGIIPGSMGTRSFIVRGRGNEESFASCSHGAGRAMSRTAARKRFTMEDHAKATAGIECRKDAEVIDETPAAYKPIGDVMHAQRDLVEVVHTLRQVLCVKG